MDNRLPSSRRFDHRAYPPCGRSIRRDWSLMLAPLHIESRWPKQEQTESPVEQDVGGLSVVNATCVRTQA